MVGCAQKDDAQPSKQSENIKSSEAVIVEKNIISIDSKVTQLESNLSAVRYGGNYGFDDFIAQGGASSNSEVIVFPTSHVLSNATELSFEGMPFGCSTISIKNFEGDSLFGRNFDWNPCEAMIISVKPESGYASISTVNTDFIQMSGQRQSDCC